MSEQDNQEKPEEKPMGTLSMLLSLASFGAAIYILYVVFFG